MRTAGKRAALLAHVHAADAGGHAGAGLGVEPFQFAGDLLGKFAGWRDDDGQRRIGFLEAVCPGEQVASHGEAESNGFA